MAIFYCRSLDYYCACVIILVMHLLCFENFLQDMLKFFNKMKRKGGRRRFSTGYSTKQENPGCLPGGKSRLRIT